MIEMGQKFGSLTVLSRTEEQRNRRQWLCQCICGAKVICFENNLTRFKSTSCTCVTRAKQSRSATKHGLHNTTEWKLWTDMRKRCFNRNHEAYDRYGGRGITVDPSWDSFPQFLSDMGKRPSPQHQIDRRNNDGPYCKDNCRWATRIEQANNKRNNTVLIFSGKSMTIAQWARETGLNQDIISFRISRMKWSVEKTLTTPHRGWGPGKRRGSIVIVAPRHKAAPD